MAYDKIIGVRTHKTVYKHGSSVIKVFDHHYSKSQILNEALNLAKVEETDLNVPSLISVQSKHDHWMIELSYIAGKSLLRLMQENPQHFSDYLDLLIDLQIQVHKTKAPILNKMKDKLGAKIEVSVLPATKRIALRLALDKQASELSFCHGDFFPGNIIIDKNKTPYIIDWAHASLGSKYADVANSYLDLWIEFNHQTANAYLNKYIKKTHSNCQDVLSWLPIVAAARSIHGIQEEKAFLIKIAQQTMEANDGC